MQRVTKHIFTFIKQRNLIWNQQMWSWEPYNATWREALSEYSRPQKLPCLGEIKTFIPKLIQDFRSSFVCKTWKRSLYKISKDKILHKGKRAGLPHQDLEAGLLLHTFIYMFMSTRAMHTCRCAHSLSSCEICFISQLLPQVKQCAADVTRQDSCSVINHPARKNNTTGDAQFCLFPHWMGH